MSRYDYRTRRKLFNRHNANPHKNFGAFEQEFTKRRRTQRTSRFVLLLMGLILLVMLAFFTAKADKKQEQPQLLKNEKEVLFSKNAL